MWSLRPRPSWRRAWAVACVAGALAFVHAAPRFDPPHDEEWWWRFVAALAEGAGPASARHDRIRTALNGLSDDALRAFTQRYVDHLAFADREALWATTRAALDTCDADCFATVRANAIFAGRAEYERLLRGEVDAITRSAAIPHDSTRNVFDAWRRRFPGQMTPTPARVPPPEEGAPRPAARTTPPRSITPSPEPHPTEEAPADWPSAPRPGVRLPAFCRANLPDVTRFRRVRVNDAQCAEYNSWSAASEYGQRGISVPNDVLCPTLRAYEHVFLARPGAEVRCELETTLPGGFAFYVVGASGIENVFLVRPGAEQTEVVALVEVYASGLGYVSAWMRGARLLRDRAGITLYWRDAVTDWNVGYDEFIASETCRAIRCERRGERHVCSAPATLRYHGGNYTLDYGDDEDAWPRIGPPRALWDCRPGASGTRG